MRRAGLFVAALLLFGVAPLGAQDRDTKVRNDREFVQELGGWVYNDLDAGLAEAKKTGKPLFVVIRCIP
jgi:serine protease Do